MNRNIATLSIVFLAAFIFPSVAGAVTEPPVRDIMVTKKAELLDKRNERKLAVTDNAIEQLKNKANKEIDRRIRSLESLIKRIEMVQKISAEQKSLLTSQVQAEISNLTTLKNKINAETDLAALRSDIKSIMSSHRIYALYIPKIHIIIKADRILTIVDKMTALTQKLETKITEAQSGGKNVSALQTELTTMKEKIAAAKTKAQNAITLVSSLTPEGYPANKVELNKAREELLLAHQNIVQASLSSKNIIKELRRLGKIKTAEPTESNLEPTAILTPTP